MKKMKVRIAALLGAFALTAWGIGLAACSHDDGDSSSLETPTSNITLTDSNSRNSYETIQAALGAIPTGGGS